MTESDTPSISGQPPAGFYPDESGRRRWWDGTQWTEHYQDSVPQPSAASSSTDGQKPAKKKKRVFLWVFMVVQVLFLIWVIAGIASGSGTPDDCGTLDAETCNDASDVGTGIGVFIVIVFWALVDFLMAVVYGIYRLTKRS